MMLSQADVLVVRHIETAPVLGMEIFIQIEVVETGDPIRTGNDQDFEPRAP
jgi:hypothetical protein